MNTNTGNEPSNPNHKIDSIAVLAASQYSADNVKICLHTLSVRAQGPAYSSFQLCGLLKDTQWNYHEQPTKCVPCCVPWSQP